MKQYLTTVFLLRVFVILTLKLLMRNCTELFKAKDITSYATTEAMRQLYMTQQAEKTTTVTRRK
jgi:hypothetical protein